MDEVPASGMVKTIPYGWYGSRIWERLTVLQLWNANCVGNGLGRSAWMRLKVDGKRRVFVKMWDKDL